MIDSQIRQLNTFWPENWFNNYIDIIQIIGKKAADLCIGEGIIFNSPDEKIQDFLDKWNKDQQLSIKLWKFAYQNSIIGRAHFWLCRSLKDNGLNLILAPILSNTRVSVVNDVEVAAQVFTAENSGDKGHYFQYDFYSRKCKITKYISDKTTIIGTVITDIPKDSIKDEEFEYDTTLDIVPIIEVTNLPKPRFYESNTFTFHPDWEPIRNLLWDLQDIVYQKQKERKKNQTWFNGHLTPEKMRQLREEFNSDIIKMLKDGFIENGGNQYTQGQNLGLQITYGDPPMENYNEDWLFTSIEIFNACGYNHPREAEKQSYTNKAQTLINGVLDEQTTRVKQQYYKIKLMRLFDYLLIDAGLWNGENERPYEFDYKSIGLADILQKDSLISSRLENGTISKIEAIQQLDGINHSNAEKKLQEIIDEQEKYDLYNESMVYSRVNNQETNENVLIDEDVANVGDIKKEIL